MNVPVFVLCTCILDVYYEKNTCIINLIYNFDKIVNTFENIARNEAYLIFNET